MRPEPGMRALAWLRGVEQASGVQPVVYTGPSFAQVHLARPECGDLVRYPLWVAEYTANGPTLACPPWAPDGWTMHQWTDAARIPGITRAVDATRARSIPGLT